MTEALIAAVAALIGVVIGSLLNARAVRLGKELEWTHADKLHAVTARREAFERVIVASWEALQALGRYYDGEPGSDHASTLSKLFELDVQMDLEREKLRLYDVSFEVIEGIGNVQRSMRRVARTIQDDPAAAFDPDDLKASNERGVALGAHILANQRVLTNTIRTELGLPLTAPGDMVPLDTEVIRAATDRSEGSHTAGTHPPGPVT